MVAAALGPLVDGLGDPLKVLAHKVNAIVVLNGPLGVTVLVLIHDADAVLGDEPLKIGIVLGAVHAKVVEALRVDLPAAALVHDGVGPHVLVGKVRQTVLVDLARRRLDARGVVVVAAEPVNDALLENLLVAGAERKLDAALGQAVEHVGGKLALGDKVEPPAVVDAAGHAHGLEVCLAGVLLGVDRGEAVDHADLGIGANGALVIGLAVVGHCQRMRQRDVVLHGASAVEVVELREPHALLVALLGLDDGLVKGEPILDLLTELAESDVGVVCVGLDDLAALPTTTVKEVSGHIEVVEVDERLQARLVGSTEQLVVPRGALLVEVAVGVEQAAPLDGGAIGIQAQVLHDAKVVLVLGHKVVAAIGTHAVIERAQILHGPGVPQVLELAALVPLALGLRTGHGRAKEKVAGQLILCHRSPRFRVFEPPIGDGFALAGNPARARTGYPDIRPTKTNPSPSGTGDAHASRLLLVTIAL